MLFEGSICRHCLCMVGLQLSMSAAQRSKLLQSGGLWMGHQSASQKSEQDREYPSSTPRQAWCFISSHGRSEGCLLASRSMCEVGHSIPTCESRCSSRALCAAMAALWSASSSPSLCFRASTSSCNAPCTQSRANLEVGRAVLHPKIIKFYQNPILRKL